MTEIEEKAYKYYKRINEDDLKNIDTFGEPTRTRIKYMQTLLDQIQNQEKEIEELKFKYQARKDRTEVIIEKQQKEIEELKEITRAYDGMAGIMPEGKPLIIADKKYFLQRKIYTTIHKQRRDRRKNRRTRRPARFSRKRYQSSKVQNKCTKRRNRGLQRFTKIGGKNERRRNKSD